MATYNRAHFIVETLLSIQNQTFIDWECIIIDDGGTDNTKEVIKPIIDEDKRFIYLNRSDKYQNGPSGCRNFGIDIAKGDYIIFFDDDDIPHPQNLELCVKELSDKQISFCRYERNVFFEHFDYNFDFSKDYTSFYIDKNCVERILNNEIHFNTCMVMWKKDCFLKNRFAENLIYGEEWELYSRIISSGYKGISINKCLFYGRKHINSSTGKHHLNNPIMIKSNVEAILLVVKNLKEKQLLTYSIKRYFIAKSINFKEYALFEKILTILELSKLEHFKWHFFYFILPARLTLHRFRKSLKYSK